LTKNNICDILYLQEMIGKMTVISEVGVEGGNYYLRIIEQDIT